MVAQQGELWKLWAANIVPSWLCAITTWPFWGVNLSRPLITLLYYDGVRIGEAWHVVNLLLPLRQFEHPAECSK